jgi:hypothetical protein
MKTRTFLLLVSLCVLSVKAQRFHHGIGVNYDQYSGSLGNSDVIGLTYHPKLLLNHENDLFTYSLTSPLSLSVMSSSARDNSSPLVELPIAFEIGFLPGAPCIAYRYCGFFAGAGVSRIISTGDKRGMTYFNTCLGARTTIWRLPLEARLNYGIGSPWLPGRYERLSFGLSYIFK